MKLTFLGKKIRIHHFWRRILEVICRDQISTKKFTEMKSKQKTIGIRKEKRKFDKEMRKNLEGSKSASRHQE